MDIVRDVCKITLCVNLNNVFFKPLASFGKVLGEVALARFNNVTLVWISYLAHDRREKHIGILQLQKQI